MPADRTIVVLITEQLPVIGVIEIRKEVQGHLEPLATCADASPESLIQTFIPVLIRYDPLDEVPEQFTPFIPVGSRPLP